MFFFCAKIDAFSLKPKIFCTIRLFRNEKITGAEMRRAIVSGIATGDALVSYWPIFSLSQ